MVLSGRMTRWVLTALGIFCVLSGTALAAGPGLSEETWAGIAIAAVGGCGVLALALYNQQNKRIASAKRLASEAHEKADKLEPRVALLESQWPIWATQIQKLEQDQVRRAADLQRSLEEWKDSVLQAVDLHRQNTVELLVQHRDNARRVEGLLLTHMEEDRRRQEDAAVHASDQAKREVELIDVLERLSEKLGIGRA